MHKLRSYEMTQGIERAASRALFFSLGLRREDFSMPLIAVVNSWNELVRNYPKNSLCIKAGRFGLVPRLVDQANAQASADFPACSASIVKG
jgi:hypothetical protein